MDQTRLPWRRPLPLVIDVDGGLLTDDPVRAGLRHCAVRRPLATLRALRESPGRADLALMDLLSSPGTSSPVVSVRAAVLDAIFIWQRFGVPAVLISGLPEKMLVPLRDALRLEAVLFGARKRRVLDGPGKAKLLQEAFGRSGFDLITGTGGGMPGLVLARRAMVAGLTERGRRRLVSYGISASALPEGPGTARRMLLRAGPGWAEHWDGPDRDDASKTADLRPGMRPPNRDASDAGNSRTGRAARS